MKRTLVLGLLTFVVLGSDGAAGRQRPERLALVSGSSLKWIDIAAREFAKKKLDINSYTIEVLDLGDSVGVVFLGPKLPGSELIAGNPSDIPGYEVEIRKRDRKVLEAHYVR